MSEIGRLFGVWKSTRLVVLTSVIAAIHAAAVIPFKVFQILPGVTDLRPAMALPIVFSILFGPAAAWGTALGNTIGDLFGSLGPGTFFGFVGNLLYGYLPWRVWSAWRKSLPEFNSPADWLVYSLATVAASAACALSIGWGIHMLRLFSFASTAGVILTNNILMGMILGPPLLMLLGTRVARMGLIPEEPAGEGPRRREFLPRLLTLVVTAVALAGILTGYMVWGSTESDSAVGMATTPWLALLLLVTALL